MSGGSNTMFEGTFKNGREGAQRGPLFCFSISFGHGGIRKGFRLSVDARVHESWTGALRAFATDVVSGIGGGFINSFQGAIRLVARRCAEHRGG